MKGVFNPNKKLDPIWNITMDKYKLNQEEDLKKEIKTLFNEWDVPKTDTKETKEKTKPKKKLGPIYFGLN